MVITIVGKRGRLTMNVCGKIIALLKVYYRCLFEKYDKQKGTVIYNQVMRKIK